MDIEDDDAGLYEGLMASEGADGAAGGYSGAGEAGDDDGEGEGDSGPVEDEKPRFRELRQRVHDAWLLEHFDFDRIFARALGAMSANLRPLVGAAAVYAVALVCVELFFFYCFGLSSFHRVHNITWKAGLQYQLPTIRWEEVRAQHAKHAQNLHPLLNLFILGVTGAHPQSAKYQVMHVLALLVTTALLWAPMQASFFRAVFNALRRPTQKIKFGDLFYYYNVVGHAGEVGKIVGLGVLFFTFSWLLKLHMWCVPLLLYFNVVTCFVYAMAAEFPTIDIPHLFAASVSAVHAHFPWICGTLLMSFMLQLIGILAFVVGLLFTGPMALLLVAFTYEELVGVRGAKLTTMKKNDSIPVDFL